MAEDDVGSRRVAGVAIVLILFVLAGVAAWALVREGDGGAGRRGAVASEDVERMESSVRVAERRQTAFEETLASTLDPPDGSDHFTEDVVWSDWGVRFSGRERVVSFLHTWSLASASMKSRVTSVYVGRDGGVSRELAWDMFGWTKAKPSTWIVEWGLRDDKVASVVLLADLGTMKPGRLPPGVELPRPAVVRSITELSAAYAKAWSSGDPAVVAGLYAAEAVREDTVFGARQEGRPAIEAFFARFLTWYPEARFTVVRPYGVGEPAVTGHPLIAAELTLDVSSNGGRSCSVKLAVVLETTGGRIRRESVYYDADSLVACGWAT